MYEFHSSISPFLEAFKQFRIASDRWSESAENRLLAFDRFCAARYPKCMELTQEIADEWCKRRTTETVNSFCVRLYTLIGIVRYLRERRLTDIAEPIVPKMEKRSTIPHAFSENELRRFFYECDNIVPKRNATSLSKKLIVPVLFRLLYSSGIRNCEARMLRVEDVDLERGILSIRCSKGPNQHYAVVHDSMLTLMQQYDTTIQKLYPQRAFFFPEGANGYITRDRLYTIFKYLWSCANGNHAVIYDFRHHYATANINHWIDEGIDFNNKLLYLSKSMGHATVENTRYYYSIIPSMSEILAQKTMMGFDAMVPEVKNDEITE